MNKSYLLTLLLTLGLAACVSTNPATGGSMLTTMSEEEEFEIGHDLVQEAVKEDGLYKENTKLTDYYQSLARNLVDVTERSDKPYDFIMLDSPTFNAWAIPGYVNTYRGILPYFNNEAELVSVMAHEAGHINARHTVRTVTKGTLASLLVAGAAIAVGVSTNSNNAANAAYTVGAFGATLAMSGYSRSYEREADALARRYMGKMGYDARESYNTFAMMERYTKYQNRRYAYFHDGEEVPDSGFYDLLRSHPRPEDRMAAVAEEVGKPDGGVRLPAGATPATPPEDPQGQKRYYDMIDGMAFGPRADQGVAGKEVLYHPKKRFVWSLPKGFSLWLNDENWLAYNNVDDTWASVTFKRADNNVDAEEMLRINFPKLRQLQPVTIAGNRAYTGVQSIKKSATGLFDSDELVGTHRVFAIPGTLESNGKEGDARDYFLISYVAPPEKFDALDSEFMASMQKFRLLSRTQAQKIEPLRVRIHKVKAGETVASLAAQMPDNLLVEEHFRTLNGLGLTEEVFPGQLVKMIRDENS